MDNGEGAAPCPVDLNAEQPPNLNISDVFEAISIADPSFGSVGVAGGGGDVIDGGDMFRPPQDQRPYCRILEQPASKALRFRYECEGRSAGSIPGARSSSVKKVYPTIEIVGHKGRAIVVVSCVTKDKPYRPHPHNLVGRDLCKKGVCTVNVSADSPVVSFSNLGVQPHPHNLVGRDLCKKGVCTVNVSADSPVVSFSNLGVQCVKRRDIEDALTLREEMRVDPFKTGFAHKNQPQSIDLNAVRLCFQVFLPDERTGKIRHALTPVVSDVIYDKKAMSDLVISRLSHCSAPVTGGTKIILLCEKVAREDIAVTFYEVGAGGGVVWREDARELLVHKQVAICCSTPRYRDPDTARHVQAFVQLRRPTDNQTSEPLPFELLPASADTDYLRRKRQKKLSDFSPVYNQPQEQDMNAPMAEYYDLIAMQREQKPIKLEPREKLGSLGSPPLQSYQSPQHDPAAEPQYQWTNMQGGLAVPGPSHLGSYQGGDINWGHTMSPLAPAVSPNMTHVTTLSPNLPHVTNLSPNMGHMSPAMGHMSPAMGHISPGMGHVSPNMGHVSPNLGHVSPNMGHVSPNMVQMQSTMLQNVAPLQQMESDPPSITGLLERGADGGSGSLSALSLSGLSGLLADADRADTLSDTLTRLSTSDLLACSSHHMQ